jgi:hypothetical protein
MQERGSKDAGRASPPLFREVQLFRMWMFWLPIVVVTCLVWWQFYEQVIRNNPQGTQPLPDWAAWSISLVFGLGLPVFGLTLRLVTELHPGELRMRVFPFRGGSIPLKDIREAEVRDYSAQREFGGWGVRTTARSGKAYSAYGNQGVQLWLKGEQRTLIGSQRARELVDALGRAGVFVR